MLLAWWHSPARGGGGLAPVSPTVNEGASTSGSSSGGSSRGSRIKNSFQNFRGAAHAPRPPRRRVCSARIVRVATLTY